MAQQTPYPIIKWPALALSPLMIAAYWWGMENSEVRELRSELAEISKDIEKTESSETSPSA